MLPFAVETAGNISRGLSSTALVPAVACTSTSTGALKPPPEGTTLVSPLVSLLAVFCVTFKITGIEGLPGLVSPLPTTGTIPPVRNTVVRKLTGAPITGCGGCRIHHPHHHRLKRLPRGDLPGP